MFPYYILIYYIVKEELMAAAWHPRRVERLLNAGYSFEEVLGD